MHHPREDCTYHSLCYTSRGALAGKRNSSMGKEERNERRKEMFYLWLYGVRHGKRPLRQQERKPTLRD